MFSYLLNKSLCRSALNAVYDLEIKKTATFRDVFFLGIMIVFGGQFFGWNQGLDEGFWGFLVSTIVMGIGYFTLTLCLAEMTSALPFSGGLYGFVRVTIDPLWGYIVAFCEVLQSMLYIATSVLSLGEMVREACSVSKEERPSFALGIEIATWILFFLTAINIQSLGGMIFLKVSCYCAIYMILAVVCLLVFAIPYGNFQHYANHYETQTSSSLSSSLTMTSVMNRFPLASWFYIGIEILPLTCVYCAKPRRDVPRAMIFCMLLFFLSTISIVFAVSSNSPGFSQDSLLVLSLTPFSFIYAKITQLTYHQTIWFTIPAVYSTAFGFFFALNRQLTSMSQSGMIPTISLSTSTCCGRSLSTSATVGRSSSYIPFSMASSIVILCCICLPIRLQYSSYHTDLLYWCVLCSYVIYLLTFISFIEMRKTFALLERSFVSPWGTSCAMLGILIFTMNFISTIAFQGVQQPVQHRIHPIAGFIGCMMMAMIWYFLYAKKYQCFSNDEQKIMFAAYVIKSNVIGKQRRKTKQKRRKSCSNSSTKSTVMSRMRCSMTESSLNLHLNSAFTSSADSYSINNSYTPTVIVDSHTTSHSHSSSSYVMRYSSSGDEHSLMPATFHHDGVIPEAYLEEMDSDEAIVANRTTNEWFTDGSKNRERIGEDPETLQQQPPPSSVAVEEEQNHSLTLFEEALEDEETEVEEQREGDGPMVYGKMVHDSTLEGIQQIKETLKNVVMNRLRPGTDNGNSRSNSRSKSLARVIPVISSSMLEENDDNRASGTGGNLEDGRVGFGQQEEGGEDDDQDDDEEEEDRREEFLRFASFKEGDDLEFTIRMERMKQMMMSIDQEEREVSATSVHNGDDVENVIGGGSGSSRGRSRGQMTRGSISGRRLLRRDSSAVVRDSFVGFFHSLSRSEDTSDHGISGGGSNQHSRGISISRLESLSQQWV